MRIDPDTYYPEQDGSPALDVIGKRQTRAKYRCDGRGPAYIKIGSRVVYQGSDILNWLEKKRVVPSTHEAA